MEHRNETEKNELPMGGPGGPGSPDGPGFPEEPREPVIPYAEKYFTDFETISDQEAAIFVTDLELMGGIETEDGLKFGETEMFSYADFAAALHKVALGDTTALCQALCPPEGMSRMEAAQVLRKALLASDGTGCLPKVYYKNVIAPEEGTTVIDRAYIFSDTTSAINNKGTSQLIVRNSHVVGSTTGETKQLSGPPAGLLVSGNMRTTLAMYQSQAFYINSKVDVANWAVFATDGAEPAYDDDHKELTLWVYGTEGNAHRGGYGTYSDLFCNVHFYGTKIQVPEIGAISGTFGKLNLDNIAAGEQDLELSARLTEEDKALQPDKTTGTVIRSGRTGIMIHCVSLPPYWGRPGYSQTELPYHSGVVTIRNSTVETDLSLGNQVQYPADAAAYIQHHKGSVILVKSCNAEILVENSQLIPDPKGTNGILHTVINSDIAFSVKVPDGTVYPGIRATLKNDKLTGDVIHEDYQRDLYLTLEGTEWSGKLYTGTVDSWRVSAEQEGFACFIIDPEGYQTVHGSHVMVTAGSVWNVTGESNLNELTISEDAQILGVHGKVGMTVDGVPTEIQAGHYCGSIVLRT